MTCANFEIALCDYLDGTLAPAEKAEVEQHLSTCASCAELARDARAAIAFMERAADVEPPPELVTRMFAIPSLPEARASMRTGILSWFRNLMQPVLQPPQTDGVPFRNHTRTLNRKSALVSAPTGHTSAQRRQPVMTPAPRKMLCQRLKLASERSSCFRVAASVAWVIFSRCSVSCAKPCGER